MLLLKYRYENYEFVIRRITFSNYSSYFDIFNYSTNKRSIYITNKAKTARCFILTALIIDYFKMGCGRAYIYKSTHAHMRDFPSLDLNEGHPTTHFFRVVKSH